MALNSLVPRLPLTIWTHTLLELLKRFAVAGTVLVTVLSFAITVQPLSEGTLGTLEALRFMLFATIPMSAYALPFAGGFAATLVFHRMAQDNELLAAHAGGVGHTKLLVPAGVFGLVLSGALLVVNDQAIPRFLRAMEQMVTEDIARVMSTRLSTGETVRIDNVMVHARDVRRIEDDTSGARDLMLLSEPAFLEIDPDGQVVWDATANRAWVWFFEGEDDSTRVVVRPEQVAVITGESRAELSDIEKSFSVRGGFGDDPKFMTLREMQLASADPDRVSMLGTSRGRLVHWLLVDALIADAAERFAADEPAILLDRNGKPVRIYAGGVEGIGPEHRFLPRSDDRGILIERERESGLDRFRAASATLTLDPDRAESARLPEYTLDLEGVRVLDDQGQAMPGDREGRSLSQLSTPEAIADPIVSMPSVPLLEQAESRVAAQPGELYFQWSAGELRRVYGRMLREILSKTHDRIALGMLGLVMSLSGAVTAMFLRDGMPLQVYLASFFPSLGAVLMISLGQQQTHGEGPVGLFVLWGGAALVLVGTLVVFLRVRRH